MTFFISESCYLLNEAIAPTSRISRGVYQMKLTTVALSTAIVIATTAAAFATCNGKQRISCAEGSIYDHNKATCVSTDVAAS